MRKTMAEVLVDHHSKHYDGELGTVFCLDPTCHWDSQAHNFTIAAEVFAQHQQDMLTAAGFGLVADAKAEALEEAAEDFESHIGVGEFAEQSTRDGRYWAHINEAWEHQGPYMDWLRARAAAVRTEDAHD